MLHTSCAELTRYGGLDGSRLLHLVLDIGGACCLVGAAVIACAACQGCCGNGLRA